MRRSYLAFDLKIAKSVAPTDELLDQRPLGVSCAAVMACDDEYPHLWYSSESDGTPLPRMLTTDLVELVHFLRSQTKTGYTITTWNGVGFDFDILAEESGMAAECRSLAIDHVDMMFHVFCQKGFPVSFDAAAKGVGLFEKLNPIDSSEVPALWQRGKTKKVLDYLKRQCHTTLEIAITSEQQRFFSWVPKRKRNANTLDIHGGWDTVREAVARPLPDTSWMTTPAWDREKFTGWLQHKEGV